MDDTTTTFKNLALELQANLDKIYQNTPGFIGSRVVSFGSGSIIANFILIFNPTTSLSEIEAIDIFRSALTSEAEITSGSGLFLTSLPAFIIFLPCEDLTCENSGTCIITSDRSGGECRCTDSWTGDRCQTSSNSKLTELPVNCPDFDRTIGTDPGQATYTFSPDFGADDVTKSVDGYRYHGGDVSVNITLGGSPVGSGVSIGTHDVIALIYDDELSKTCTGTYHVQDDESPFIMCSNLTVPFGNVVANYDAVVSDNVDEPSSLRVDFAPKQPGQRLDPGVNEISATVTDSAGNINSTVCYIDIQMTELPVEILQASAAYDGNTYSLFFRGHLKEGLTSLNFAFYGDVIYDPIIVNGVEQFQPADLSPGVNNIRIEATDGVLSKTIQFVLNVTRNQPVNYELTGNMVLARIKGIDAPFTQDLLDDTTTTFKNLALELQANLDKIYQNTPGFIGSRVVSFGSGSIIANFILIFNPTTSLSEIEAIDIFRSALTSEAEITSGSGLFLTSLPAFIIFLPCEDLTCENSGTCIITSDRSGGECRCTDSWTGDRCQTSSNSKPTSIAVIVGNNSRCTFILHPHPDLGPLRARFEKQNGDEISEQPGSCWAHIYVWDKR
ncbi:uncharacterized protein LOC105443449 [Strongylocentrotus purpuratus]|uniref:Uncharacterized protein n=1 Tax=Strongylocentrotus purpuratus TaxID=7668 RepID=A0A7M7PFK9_STRPU|nr:uncharacterized protein LOC105443449 [Strongylocentrotus purpuratus]